MLQRGSIHFARTKKEHIMRDLYWLAGLAVFFLGAAPVLAQDKSPDAQKAIDAVRKVVDDLGAKGTGDITLKGEAAVKKTFADYQIVNVRYRIFPVARILPKGLRASNLFAVDKDGKVEHLKDVKTLEKFFQEHQQAVKNKDGAGITLAAWLTLTQEFHQDGFFTFEILEKEFAADATKASGRIVVMKGGNGDLNAELGFDKDGKLAKAEEKATIRPGPRPICQATKLLDADPIVRRIAEQDLLIMGLAARDYLMEQRDVASPDLRHAIDRLWAQIQKNGW
jgi:hypothetical protein